MQIDHDALVLVVDGRKMLMFRNRGDADYPNLEVEMLREQDNPPDRDQASDAPGRTHASSGTARSAVERTDFHQLEEDRFAMATATLLKQRALAQNYEKLIIVAPPQTLGELRKHYHKEVESRLVGELDKDLASHPVGEIEKIIMQS